MRSRMIRGLLAAGLAISGIAALTSSAQAQQTGNAFLVFDVDTGELRMNPGTGNDIAGFTIDSGGLLAWNGTAVFPSGNYPFAPTNTSNRIGAAFAFGTLGGLTSPNVVPDATFLSATNLQLGSPNVVASTTPGFEGSPEWVFGNVGTAGLSLEQALNALGASTQGGLATGNRSYTLSPSGSAQFAVYTVSAVPEPSTIAMAGCGIAALGGAEWRRRRRKLAAVTA